ncbi:MAG TPA: hypothetical protein VNZ58_02810 [Thermomicrobiales bacterium]|nr:hypothetical protein [Thermomicrobiales bacterium]
MNDDDRPSRHTPKVPTRGATYERAFFSALAAAAVALLVLKMLMGLAFMAAVVVAVVAFIIFFGMTLRTTPRREE